MTTRTATTTAGPKGFRWLYLILGIVLFVFGVGIVRHPAVSYFGLAMYFSIMISFVLLVHPAIAEDILPYIVGFILMFKSIDFISESIEMSSLRVRGWGWILTAGIITLIFSFMIVFFPVFGIFNIIIWTGLSFMFAGISSFIYAFVK